MVTKPLKRKCKHYEICGLEALANSKEGFCILHSKRKNKDRKEFRKALESLLKRGRYRFDHIVFPIGEFDFIELVFNNEVSFNGATFNGKVNFSGSTFQGKVSLRDVTFDDEVNFSNVTFESGADFSQIKFQDAHFYNTVFKGQTIFTETCFNGVTNFMLSSFKKSVLFFSVVFNGVTHFYHTSFECDVSFNYSQFRNMTTFAGKEAAFIFSKEHETELISVLFERPSKVYFDCANFTKCSFLRSDLRGVHLTKVEWAKIKNRQGLYDELKAIAEKKKEDYPLVEELYTQLKHHWEEKRNYEMAGFFHYGEKEMRRKARSFFSDPALWLYWMFSGYGESATKAFVWILVIWVGFAFYYSAFTINSVTAFFLSRIIPGLNYSLQVMTFQNPSGSSFAETIQSILSPILVALFVLALRRRMSR